MYLQTYFSGLSSNLEFGKLAFKLKLSIKVFKNHKNQMKSIDQTHFFSTHGSSNTKFKELLIGPTWTL
jgi:hypothetical protein